MRHSFKDMQNVSTSTTRRFMTFDGDALIEQMTPRLWRIQRRGMEPFFVTTQALAVAAAFAIQSGKDSLHGWKRKGSR